MSARVNIIKYSKKGVKYIFQMKKPLINLKLLFANKIFDSN